MEGRLNFIYLLCLGVVLMVLSCTEHKAHTAPAVRDRDSASMMVSYGVNTLISDSGVIKYRIVTERWDVNTIKNPTRWTFDKGIFMEQFDENFHIEGYIQADSAWYYDQNKFCVDVCLSATSTDWFSIVKNCGGMALDMSSIATSSRG